MVIFAQIFPKQALKDTIFFNFQKRPKNGQMAKQFYFWQMVSKKAKLGWFGLFKGQMATLIVSLPSLFLLSLFRLSVIELKSGNIVADQNVDIFSGDLNFETLTSCCTLLQKCFCWMTSTFFCIKRKLQMIRWNCHNSYLTQGKIQ